MRSTKVWLTIGAVLVAGLFVYGGFVTVEIQIDGGYAFVLDKTKPDTPTLTIGSFESGMTGDDSHVMHLTLSQGVIQKGSAASDSTSEYMLDMEGRTLEVKGTSHDGVSWKADALETGKTACDTSAAPDNLFYLPNILELAEAAGAVDPSVDTSHFTMGVLKLTSGAFGVNRRNACWEYRDGATVKGEQLFAAGVEGTYFRETVFSWNRVIELAVTRGGATELVRVSPGWGLTGTVSFHLGRPVDSSYDPPKIGDANPHFHRFEKIVKTTSTGWTLWTPYLISRHFATSPGDDCPPGFYIID